MLIIQKQQGLSFSTSSKLVTLFHRPPYTFNSSSKIDRTLSGLGCFRSLDIDIWYCREQFSKMHDIKTATLVALKQPRSIQYWIHSDECEHWGSSACMYFYWRNFPPCMPDVHMRIWCLGTLICALNFTGCNPNLCVEVIELTWTSR